jgi:chromosome segregation ATPase
MESLASSIQETISVFNIHHDIQLIDSINNKINQLDSLENQNIESFNTRIENLQRQLENIISSIKSLKSSSQNKSTRSELKKLQNEIFDSARNLTSLNMEINSLKLSYNENMKKLDDLENDLIKLNNKFISNINSNDLDSNPNPNSNDLKTLQENSNLIKFKLFQSTGLKFNPQSREVLILNKKQNNLTLLKIDDSYSEYFISNFLWDNM